MFKQKKKTIKISAFMLLAFVFLGCDIISKDPEPISEYEWRKLVLKNELTVYSISGKINERLIVGTLRSILITEDQGQTWTKVFSPAEPIGAFRKYGNSLLAIANFIDYYSLNNGGTWQELNREISLEWQDSVRNSEGKIFKIQSNYDGELATPSYVLESKDEGLTWLNIFPFEHWIYSFSIDEDDRLYLGINGAIWGNSGGFVEDEDNNAIIYYTETK